MSFQMCSQCFAELYQQKVCSFCGYDMDGEHQDRSATRTGLAVQYSKFELTGMPFQVQDWIRIPKGTLFNSRYSVLQYKQIIDKGACYIAYDHWTGQHTFLTLWPEPSVTATYHQSIQSLSTVYDSGNEPWYSAFRPQEGLPIVQALSRLGWTTGRIWEFFRQACQLTITAETKAGRLPLFPPDNLWVAPNGLVEMSVQPTQNADFSTPHVQQLIELLGWLYEPNSELRLSSFPLKLRPIIVRHWEHPGSTQVLWTEINEAIRTKGWYRLPNAAKERLLNEHHPNVVWLLDEQIEIPSSIQLCVWNAVSGSWRLREGKVLLSTSLNALFEAGMVDSESNRDLDLLEALTLGESIPCSSDLESVLIQLRYGNQSEARTLLASFIRSNTNFESWLQIVEAFFGIGEVSSALEMAHIAATRFAFVREALDLAALVYWHTMDVLWVKRLLRTAVPDNPRLWELTDWVEGWMTLCQSPPDPSVLVSLEELVSDCDVTTRQEWERHCLQHFGPMMNLLFPFV